MKTFLLIASGIYPIMCLINAFSKYGSIRPEYTVDVMMLITAVVIFIPWWYGVYHFLSSRGEINK